MKFYKKNMCFILALLMIVNVVIGSYSYDVNAAEKKVFVPTFKIKTINDGTGVKIEINKTKGAEGYHIYVPKRQNADSKYYNQNGNFESEDDFWIFRDRNDRITLEKNGQKKRSYTINGLPEGEYSFVVAACKVGTYGELYDVTYSSMKSVSIKAGKKVKRKEISYDFSSVKAGDTIKFGAYEQDDDMTNGEEPIEWIVLSAENKKIMAVSKYVLDRLPYDKISWSSTERDEYDQVYTVGEDNIEWDSLIEWLNGTFYKRAFTKKERKMIGYTYVKKHEEIKTEDDFKDIETKVKYKVALLTENILLNEKYGFSTDKNIEDIMRRCAPTEFAIAQGVQVYDDKYKTSEGKPACGWWGMQTDLWHNVPLISTSGRIFSDYVYCESGLMNRTGCGVRPAICIKIQ